MKTISSRGERDTRLTERRLMKFRPSGVLLPLFALTTMIMMPMSAIAKDKDEGDGQRRSLINHIGVKAELAAVQAQVADLRSQVLSLTTAESSLLTQLKSAQNDIAALQSKLTALSAGGNSTNGNSGALNTLAKYVTIDPNPINGMNGPHIIFTGVNVHIRSGSGSTGDGGTLTGLGNLVLGYNAIPVQGGGQRSGSHNIVGGDGNSFTSYGGLVLGSQNSLGGLYTAIVGGESNQAVGFASSILGGRANFVGSGDQTIP